MTDKAVATLLFIALIISVVMIAIFVASSIIFILNLIKCIKFNWPKKNLIPVIISGIILTHMTIVIIIEIFEIILRMPSGYETGSSSLMETYITYLSALR